MDMLKFQQIAVLKYFILTTITEVMSYMQLQQQQQQQLAVAQIGKSF